LVTANFSINSYGVTYNAGSNGSVTGTTVQSIDYGSNSTTVTAVPSTGYSFSSWSDGVLTAARTDTVTDNISVTANFSINSYGVTYNAGSHGSVTGSTAQSINYGSNSTTVTAVPATGYSFSNWSDGVSTAGRIDTVTGNVLVTANFSINSYGVTYNAGPHGSVTGTTVQSINYGSNSTTVTAVPETGYSFSSWSDGVSTAERIDTVTGNVSVTANFSINSYGVTYNAGSHGSITGTTVQSINYGSNSTTVTAVPATGYRFSSWSDGVSTAARTESAVSKNVSVTANFEVITPNSVTGLTAVNTGNRVFLTWATANYATSYSIARSIGAYPTQITDLNLVSANITTSNYSDLLLSDGRYYYSAFSVNHGAYSLGLPATASVAIDTTAPGEVEGLIATANGAAISLRWTTPNDSDFSGATVYIARFGAQLSYDVVTQNLRFDPLIIPNQAADTYVVLIKTSDRIGNMSNGVTRSVTVRINDQYLSDNSEIASGSVTLTVSNNVVLTTPKFGDGGAATVNLETTKVANGTEIGVHSGTGTLVLATQDSKFVDQGDVTVGKTGTGRVVQSQGVVQVAGSIILGKEVGSTGNYDLSGGTLKAGRIEIGGSGSGTLSWTGGTIETPAVVGNLVNQGGT
jgi:hypothetical protein